MAINAQKDTLPLVSISRDKNKFSLTALLAKELKVKENEILSYNTINKVLILLKKIFDTGIRKSFIDKNPVENLRKLPISKPDIK